MARGDLETGSYWNYTGSNSGKTHFDFFFILFEISTSFGIPETILLDISNVLHKRVQSVVVYLTKCTSIVPKSIFTT